MNDFPMDTPLDQIPDEAVAAMPKEELLRRALTVAGSIEDFMVNIALDAASSTLNGVQRAAFLKSQIPADDESRVIHRLVAVSTAEGILADGVALISIGREIERFVRDNPDFPESRTGDGGDALDIVAEAIGVFLGSLLPEEPVAVGANDGASASESV